MTRSNASAPWRRITDLPADWRSLARPDIDSALGRWQAERRSLRDPSKATELEERLATLWSIETGVIERLYTIDRGTTETLVNLGLQAIERFTTTGRLSANAARLIADQRAGLEFLFAYVNGERRLTISFIKELHQLLTRNQTSVEKVDQFGQRFHGDLIRGSWKILPNNPSRADGSIHQYCPPEFVNDEMEQLLQWHEQHMTVGVRPEVEAAWLHHRFTEIHPFEDGNGRVARALATMIFLKAGFLPLVVRNDLHRDGYIDALGLADRADLAALVQIFSDIESNDLNDAIGFVRELRGQGISQIAAAAAEAVKRRVHEDEAALHRITDELAGITKARLEEVAYELRSAFNAADVEIGTRVGESDETTETWWNYQLIALARKFNYRAELARPRRWIQLVLRIAGAGAPPAHIVVSFHEREARTRLMSAVLFLTTTEGGDSREPESGTDTAFVYSISSMNAVESYRTWLDRGLPRLLEIWHARI